MKRGFAVIGLEGAKDPANLGGVMRAAGCYGVDMIALTGGRMRHSKTDTQKAWKHVPVIEVADMLSALPYGATPVCIELMEGATPLPRFVHPERAFYIFGPEDGSVDRMTSAWCRARVYVPTKFCMNLAACVNVVLYDRLAKESA